MIILRICLLFLVAGGFTNAVINKDIQRREGPLTNSYGPPPSGLNDGLPIPIYGSPGNGIKYPPPPIDIPPLQHFNSNQQFSKPPRQPHREYGVPVSKYDSPKIDLVYGTPLYTNSLGKQGQEFGKNGKDSFFKQVKSHFGVQRPVYGPPHLQKPNDHNHRPFTNYGPPPLQKPIKNYGVPNEFPVQHYNKGSSRNQYFNQVQQHNINHNINKPLQQIHPGLKPNFSYRPLNHSPTPIYGPPSTSYGVPDNTIKLDSDPVINVAAISAALSLPQNQVQLQIGTQGSQLHDGPLPTVSCDGWRPIPGPVNQLTQNNFADFGQHSEKHFVQNHATQIEQNFAQNNETKFHGGQFEQNLLVQNNEQNLAQQQHGQSLAYNGLSDDQIIAVALQSGFIENGGLDLTNNLPEISYNGLSLNSYQPNSGKQVNYNTLNGNNANFGLLLPGDILTMPSSTQSGLGIQYGSQSGNLRPWLNAGSAPKIPVSFRPPVPEGLLESIGKSVKHLDQYGIKPDNTRGQYIPPPPAEVAQQHQQQQQQQQQQHHYQNQQRHLQQNQHNQHNQQEQQLFDFNDQNLQSYASELISYQALPAINDARFNQLQGCGHGPNLVGTNLRYDFGKNQLSNPNQNQGFINNFNNDQSDGENFIDKPDNAVYESKQSSVSIQQSVSPLSEITDSTVSETKPDQLPGLEGINIVSAQKSHSIPIQGQLGTYQLQFQNANGINGYEGQPNHEQILSQGLLQSILSAIEQPNESHDQLQQNKSHMQERVDHKHFEESHNNAKSEEILEKTK